MMNRNQLISGVRSVIEDVGNSLPERNIEDALELLEYNEWGVSLSLICTQLNEYQITITSKNYDKIEALGLSMGLPSKEWVMLKELIQ